MKHSNFLSFIKKGTLVSILLFTGSASLPYQNLPSIDDPSASNHLSLAQTSTTHKQNDSHVSRLNPNAESYIPFLVWENKVAEINNGIFNHIDDVYHMMLKNNSKFVKDITAYDVKSDSTERQIVARNTLFGTLQFEIHSGSYYTLMSFLSNSYRSYRNNKETLTESDEKIYNMIEIIWHNFEKIFCLYVINKSIELPDFKRSFNCRNLLYILPGGIKSLFSNRAKPNLTSTILKNVRNNPVSMARLFNIINQ